MIKYIGVKIIEADPLNLGEYNRMRGWIIPDGEDPNREGYLVKYSDNYISWSPKEAFDESYRPITDMTFGLAVEAVKKGFKIARRGWNGRGMFVYYVPENRYPTVTDVAKKEFGDYAVYNPYFAIKNVNGTVSTWVPSVNDCLAEDWHIL